jgi:hypothetical protein
MALSVVTNVLEDCIASIFNLQTTYKITASECKRPQLKSTVQWEPDSQITVSVLMKSDMFENVCHSCQWLISPSSA